MSCYVLRYRILFSPVFRYKFPLILIPFIFLFFNIEFLFAHGGASPVLSGNPAAPPPGAKVIRDQAGRLVYMEYDSNDDGKNDIWNFYEKGKLIRQNSDRNGDGKADIYFFLTNGKVTSLSRDANCDGYFESTEKYSGGFLAYQSMDLNKDGIADVNHIMENGAHVRTETDTDFDGKIDSWIFFDKDENRKLVLTDANKDGVPDTKTAYDKQGAQLPSNTQMVENEVDIPLENIVEDGDTLLEEVTVVEERSLTAASDKVIRDKDFKSFPRHNPSDLVRLIPSIHVSQHTGGAKAYQYFLRGFDAEHGQDLAAYLDGVPLNEPSQVHGHGYLDLHFLIPETISSIKIIKGPYDPEYGNFATAGAINFIPRQTGENNEITATAGMYGFAKVRGLFSITADPYLMVGAIEADHIAGYTDPGDSDGFRANTGHTFLLGNWGVNLMTNHYGQKSAASDVIPKEWVDNGGIGRFGSIDSSDRVNSNRHLTALTADLSTGPNDLRLQGFYDYKNTTIWSNYTYFLLNPEKGDQQEMFDCRDVFGFNFRYKNISKLGSTIWATSFGVQWRYDSVSQILANTTDRERWNLINDLEFSENALGAWLKENLTLTKWLTVVPGARFDLIAYSGKGTRDRRYFNIYTNQGDVLDDEKILWNETASIFSPKASVIFSPVPAWDIFLNYGEGFFSNTSLQMAGDPKNTIPKVKGGEVSTRVNLWKNRVSTSAAAWFANKEEDLLFDPQTGIASLKESTIRQGLDGEIRVCPTDWLYFLTDGSYVNARFAQSGDKIPNGPVFIMSNGIGLSNLKGFRGMILGRLMGKRELDQGDFAPPYYIMDTVVGYDQKEWGVELAIDNLLNTKWEDAVFSYETRPEKNGESYNGIHFTPGTPFFARFSVTAKF